MINADALVRKNSFYNKRNPDNAFGINDKEFSEYVKKFNDDPLIAMDELNELMDKSKDYSGIISGLTAALNHGIKLDDAKLSVLSKHDEQLNDLLRGVNKYSSIKDIIFGSVITGLTVPIICMSIANDLPWQGYAWYAFILPIIGYAHINSGLSELKELKDLI